MEQRVSLVTLAVRDLAASRAFYEALGWKAGFVADEVAFFQAGGMVVGLWSMDAFTAETGLPARSGGICLAHNVADRRAVDAVLAEAGRAGARVVEAQERPWGGYSGYFADPDGHRWEIAWNPAWPLGPDGRVTLG